MRCGTNTGSRNPSACPALVTGTSSLTLLWCGLEGHPAPVWDQENASLVPVSCQVMLIRFLFTMHPLVTWCFSAGTCGGKRGGGVGAVLGPQLSAGLSDFVCLTPEPATSVLTGVRGC